MAWGSPDVALTVAPPAGMVILPVVPRSDLLGDTKKGGGLFWGIPIWLSVCLEYGYMHLKRKGDL